MTRPVRPARFTWWLTILVVAILPRPCAAQLGSPGTQFWNQGSPDIGAPLVNGAETGRALAIGDFDCDGIGDLAIGMPGDEAGGDAEAGRVLVLYGSHAGPLTPGHDLLSQDTPGVLDATEAGDRFGDSLAAGDFDNDGCDDLAIGAPGEGIEVPAVVAEAGAVHVLYGSVLGLTVAADDFFTQDSTGVLGLAQAEDHFGSTLLAADLDLDGDDELAVGVPDEDLEGTPTIENAGAVHVFLGSLGGLASAASLLFVAGDAVLNYIPEDFERLGAALAAGDILIGGDVELAVGRPGRAGDDPGEVAAGGVEVISNVVGVLTGDAYSASFSPGQEDVPGVAEAFDYFGAALAAGDFDGDGFDQLVVGVPGEDLESVPAEAAGAVVVLEAASAFEGNQLWTQEDLAPEHADPFDRFGEALATGDFNGDGLPDLAIGVPGESLSSLIAAGVVHVLYGEAGTGLVAIGRQLLLQTLDPSEDGDEFGAALAAGPISGHTGEDLAIGAPREDLAGVADTGGVNTIFSTVLFIDGFESSNTGAWSD